MDQGRRQRRVQLERAVERRIQIIAIEVEQGPCVVAHVAQQVPTLRIIRVELDVFLHRVVRREQSVLEHVMRYDHRAFARRQPVREAERRLSVTASAGRSVSLAPAVSQRETIVRESEGRVRLDGSGERVVGRVPARAAVVLLAQQICSDGIHGAGRDRAHPQVRHGLARHPDLAQQLDRQAVDEC